MAKSRNNVITYGLSGKIGDILIFRQRDGQTIVAKVPNQSKTLSEEQIKVRKRFQRATIYAKGAIADPELKELYEAEAKKQKGMTAYNVAVADFYHGPDIEVVDLSSYSGTIGDEIRVIAHDNFAVKSVHVKITNADGSLVKEGYAVNSAGNIWIYTASANNESLDGDKIVVTASDIPGNIAVDSHDP
jgi:hypothetical protein